ncbi:MAG: hypothetical protein ACK4UN_01720 [Limisphaerales bacterium]
MNSGHVPQANFLLTEQRDAAMVATPGTRIEGKNVALPILPPGLFGNKQQRFKLDVAP